MLERLIRNPDFQGSLILLCPASLYGAAEHSGLELCLYCVVRDIGPRHCHLLMEMNPSRQETMILREHIPHTWASSNDNLFQSNFSVWSNCEAILRKAPDWPI